MKRNTIKRYVYSAMLLTLAIGMQSNAALGAATSSSSKVSASISSEATSLAAVLESGKIIPQVVKKVSPAVVGIIGRPTATQLASGVEDRFTLAHGTGVIIKKDGWIVTNAHVVKDMSQIIVVTADGKQYAGKKTHIDEESDLAMIKINAANLPTATIADNANLEVGETVIAIGTPVSFALRNTATVGVLSGMNRSMQSNYRLLQTDAAINPGNSGGPLVNLQGEVIGINTIKFVDVSIDNMGFSIPADTVQYVVNHFFKYGKVKRPSLGWELEESWEAIVGLPTDKPLKVLRVDAASPAAKAGIKAGDELYAINGTSVANIVDITELLKKYLPGQQVKLTLQTEGDLVTKTVTLGEETAN